MKSDKEKEIQQESRHGGGGVGADGSGPAVVVETEECVWKQARFHLQQRPEPRRTTLQCPLQPDAVHRTVFCQGQQSRDITLQRQHTSSVTIPLAMNRLPAPHGIRVNSAQSSAAPAWERLGAPVSEGLQDPGLPSLLGSGRKSALCHFPV